MERLNTWLWRIVASSVGKESTCNAGDPSSISGSGRSPGEGIGYPLQYSWTSFVAQLVKNPSCNAGDLGLIPGLGRCPGEGKCYPLQYSGWRIPWTVQSMGSQRVGHDWVTFPFTCLISWLHEKQRCLVVVGRSLLDSKSEVTIDSSNKWNPLITVAEMWENWAA